MLLRQPRLPWPVVDRGAPGALGHGGMGGVARVDQADPTANYSRVSCCSSAQAVLRAGCAVLAPRPPFAEGRIVCRIVECIWRGVRAGGRRVVALRPRLRGYCCLPAARWPACPRRRVEADWLAELAGSVAAIDDDGAPRLSG